MLVQIALQGKRLVAALAVEVFESRVGLHVSAQVGPVCKGLSTMGATVRLVPCVAPHVPLWKLKINPKNYFLEGQNFGPIPNVPAAATAWRRPCRRRRTCG